MSRRSSGFTGANAIPLGTRNRTIGSKGAVGTKRQFTSSPPRECEQQYERREPQMQPSDSATIALKAAQAAAANLAKLAQKTTGSDTWSAAPPSQPTPPMASINSSSGGDADRGRPRKKKSRWATETVKTVVPGMPTTMPTNLTPQQERTYIVQLQIEDITRKLKSGDLGIAPNPEDRSPSPEPIYNGEGKRMNTREYRTRKRLEEERHKLVQDMTELNTEYKPPADYKPLLQRVSERVAIPADINPNINFVGLLIGPRGNTLKKIEKESNCKIMIRGKGSVKEGKVVRKDNHPLPGEDEPLHALVSSNSIENVKKAVNEIQEIIKQGIEQPEEENDLRKLQLMELAKLNGTLREDLMPRERAWLRPENQNITNTTICNKCGGRGHLAQDCRSTGTVSNQDSGQGGAGGGAASGIDRAKMDSEYMSLMAEIGEHPAPATGNDNKMSGGGGNSNSGGNSNNGGGNNNNRGPRGPMMNSGNNYNQGNNGNGGNGPRGGYGSGGPRPPWMGGGGPRGPPGYGHGPRGGGYGPRGGGGGGGYGNGPPMMGRGGPPPPWMAPPGAPYGNPHNQWGPPGGMSGGYPGMNPHEMGGDGSGQMAPWQQQQQQGDGQQQQAGGGHYGQQQQAGMYAGGQQAGGDQSGGGYGVQQQQPPPPPPTSAPQPPPPPSSSNDMSQWQQQWTDTSGQQQADNSAMGYGNAAMWNMNPPPMPSGPGPVPPPPPTSQDSANSGQMDYNAMMGGYAMQPAPPPPPPQ